MNQLKYLEAPSSGSKNLALTTDYKGQLTAATCPVCGRCLEITIQAVLESWEDEDLHRYYPVSCPDGRIDCAPAIIRDGGTGVFRNILNVLANASPQAGIVASKKEETGAPRKGVGAAQ